MADSGSPPRAAVLFNGVFARLSTGLSCCQVVHQFDPDGQLGVCSGHPCHMFDQAVLAESPALTKLAAALVEPGVTDLVCNGHETTLVLRAGRWQPTQPVFDSAAELERASRALASKAGKRLDLSHPFTSFTVNARLRFHLVLASAVSTKTLLSIRVFGERPFGLQQLVALGQMSEFTRSRLVSLMNAGRSILISGASGSGKTSLLRALLFEVEHTRVITIEDIDELRISSPNSVSLLSREANVEGKGAIEMNSLLVEALRMRPDRVVIGEVRSAELITVLQAANSGHAVAATIHANSADEVEARMVSIAVQSQITPAAVRAMAASAFDAYLHIENNSGQRCFSLRERAA